MNFNFLTILLSISIFANFISFFLVPRKPDLLTLISFFSIIITLPLFYDDYKFVDGYILSSGYHAYTYITFIFLSLCLATLSFVTFNKRFLVLKFKTSFSILLLFSWFVLLLNIILSVGYPQILFSHKTYITQKVGILFEVFVWLTPFVAIVLYYKLNQLRLIMLFIFIITLLILGDRTAPALIVTTIFFIHLINLPKVSLFTSKKFLFLLILITSTIFCGSLSKALYSDFRNGGFSSLLKGFESRQFTSYFTNIEIMNTPYILNLIVLNDFSTDGYTILSSPLSLSPVPRSFTGDSSSEFGKRLQESLFSDLKFGVGHSYFGEFYSAFGLIGILIGLIIFLILSISFNFLIFNLKSSYMIVVFMIFGSLLSFYAYRNTLSTLFGFYRFIFYPSLLLYLSSNFLYQLSFKKY